MSSFVHECQCDVYNLKQNFIFRNLSSVFSLFSHCNLFSMQSVLLLSMHSLSVCFHMLDLLLQPVMKPSPVAS